MKLPHSRLPFLVGACVVVVMAACGSGCRLRLPNKNAVPCAPLYRTLSADDEALLDDLERRIVDYFWTEVYPETGIAIDHTENRIGKVAATGFGLAALCIGAERGWIPRQAAYDRVWLTLNSFWDDPDDPSDPCVDGQFGLFWHFVDGRTGRMKPVDCVAMCDSADFIAGVLVAGEYFKGTPVEELVKKIYDRVEWDRFVSRRPDGKPGLLSFGWVPKHVSESYYETDGLLDFNMSGLADNSLLIYVLALGSDTHPIPQETWEQYVDSYLLDEYAGYECVFAGQLFSRQVPHAFIRFSRKRDRKIDYFLDTVNALLADREFNIRVNGYPPQLWGLTDCFGKDSYSHAAPPGPIMNDGTVGTTALVGALPHIPELSMEAIRYVLETFGDRAYGRYGFTSSVNLKNNYVSPLYVGIELGPMVLLIENYRSGLIWDLFSRSPVMSNFVRRAGMSGVVDDFELPPEAPAYAIWTASRGWASITNDSPRHGRRCLSLAAQGAFDVRGQLTQNDLLDFDFHKYLSVWTRDIEVTECIVTVSGREIVLERSRVFDCGEWKHLYYAWPMQAQRGNFCALTFRGRAIEARPAMDDITLERRAPAAPPLTPQNVQTAVGPLPETVWLRWQAPSESGAEPPVEFIATITESNGPIRLCILPATVAPGEMEQKLVKIGENKVCQITVAACDRYGHMSGESAPVLAEAAAGRLKSVAYSTKEQGLQGWSSWSSNIQLRVDWIDNVPALRVDYRKSQGWELFALDMDPRMASLHRYLRIKWRGKGSVLAKLWCSDEQQADLRLLTSDSEDDWVVDDLDMHRVRDLYASRDGIRKLLLFPAPGQWSATGTIWIAEIRFAN